MSFISQISVLIISSLIAVSAFAFGLEDADEAIADTDGIIDRFANEVSIDNPSNKERKLLRKARNNRKRVLEEVEKASSNFEKAADQSASNSKKAEDRFKKGCRKLAKGIRKAEKGLEEADSNDVIEDYFKDLVYEIDFVQKLYCN